MGHNINTGQLDAAAVFDSWMNSADACAAIMDPDFVHMGAGAYADMDAPLASDWTQTFGAP